MVQIDTAVRWCPKANLSKMKVAFIRTTKCAMLMHNKTARGPG